MKHLLCALIIIFSCNTGHAKLYSCKIKIENMSLSEPKYCIPSLRVNYYEYPFINASNDSTNFEPSDSMFVSDVLIKGSMIFVDCDLEVMVGYSNITMTHSFDNVNILRGIVKEFNGTEKELIFKVQPVRYWVFPILISVTLPANPYGFRKIITFNDPAGASEPHGLIKALKPDSQK